MTMRVLDSLNRDESRRNVTRRDATRRDANLCGVLIVRAASGGGTATCSNESLPTGQEVGDPLATAMTNHHLTFFHLHSCVVRTYVCVCVWYKPTLDAQPRARSLLCTHISYVHAMSRVTHPVAFNHYHHVIPRRSSSLTTTDTTGMYRWRQIIENVCMNGILRYLDATLDETHAAATVVAVACR